jgi:hypothetical protein
VTPVGVTRRGRLVWEDERGERDFSPATQRRVRVGGAVFLALVLLLALGVATGVVPAAPWSAMGGAS